MTVLLAESEAEPQNIEQGTAEVRGAEELATPVFTSPI
jgi:hypothetical protein